MISCKPGSSSRRRVLFFRISQSRDPTPSNIDLPKAVEQLLDSTLDLVANIAEELDGFSFGIGNVPVNSRAGRDERALIAAAHRDDVIPDEIGQCVEPL